MTDLLDGLDTADIRDCYSETDVNKKQTVVTNCGINNGVKATVGNSDFKYALKCVAKVHLQQVKDLELHINKLQQEIKSVCTPVFGHIRDVAGYEEMICDVLPCLQLHHLRDIERLCAKLIKQKEERGRPNHDEEKACDDTGVASTPTDQVDTDAAGGAGREQRSAAAAASSRDSCLMVSREQSHIFDDTDSYAGLLHSTNAGLLGGDTTDQCGGPMNDGQTAVQTGSYSPPLFKDYDTSREDNASFCFLPLAGAKKHDGGEKAVRESVRYSTPVCGAPVDGDVRPRASILRSDHDDDDMDGEDLGEEQIPTQQCSTFIHTPTAAVPGVTEGVSKRDTGRGGREEVTPTTQSPHPQPPRHRHTQTTMTQHWGDSAPAAGDTPDITTCTTTIANCDAKPESAAGAGDVYQYDGENAGAVAVEPPVKRRKQQQPHGNADVVAGRNKQDVVGNVRGGAEVKPAAAITGYSELEMTEALQVIAATATAAPSLSSSQIDGDVGPADVADARDKIAVDDSFDRLPTTNAQGVTYKYVEPRAVRKKEERDKLPAHACKQCSDYFSHMTDAAERAAHIQATCRHRARHEPPRTPEHFWEVGMPSTQECKARGYHGMETQIIQRKPPPQQQQRKKKKYT